MGQNSTHEITKLLQGWQGGDRAALDALVPVVYEELRHLARCQLRKERPDHTLQSTALVHEAYFRLVGQNLPQWESRTHFFAIAAQLMRQILVDYARQQRAAKRDAGLKLVLDDALAPRTLREAPLGVLDDALQELSRLDPRQGQIVELRFFGGLSIEETSQVLGVSPATVKRDWTTARLWLQKQIGRG